MRPFCTSTNILNELQLTNDFTVQGWNCFINLPVTWRKPSETLNRHLIRLRLPHLYKHKFCRTQQLTAKLLGACEYDVITSYLIECGSCICILATVHKQQGWSNEKQANTFRLSYISTIAICVRWNKYKNSILHLSHKFYKCFAKRPHSVHCFWRSAAA